MEIKKADISKIVNEGLFKTYVDFNKDLENLKNLVQYCSKLQPEQTSFTNASSLIKFYRLPIIIAFSGLYHKAKKAEASDITPEIKSILEDIAAWVNSLIQKLQIQIFQEIRFIFNWGRAKKKYNMSVSPAEIRFAKYISSLSKKRQMIKEKLKKEEDVQEQIKELQNCVLPEQLNYFQQNFVDVIKRSVVLQANSVMFAKQQKPKRQQIQSIASKKQEEKTSKQVNTSAKKPEKQIIIQQNLVQKDRKKEEEKSSKPEVKQKRPLPIYEQLPYSEERKLPICCRSYFLQDQIIEQAQNQTIEYKKYKYPFCDKPNQKPTKREKIKKTLCGFLNNIGGIIYFGISQHPDTKKRSIHGYDLAQRYKSDFECDLFDLLKDVLPDVQKNCVVRWVPIKNQHKNEFIPGRYIAKVIIQKGAKDQLYSYIHNGVQRFVFKTQNEFLVVNQPQRILKVFRNKLQNAERPVYKLHQYPCREPLLGKPIYEQASQFSEDILSRQFPSLKERNSSDRIQSEKAEKRYKQKESDLYLIRGFGQQKLKNELNRRKISYELHGQIDQKEILVKLFYENQILELEQQGFILYQVYTTIKADITEKQGGLINDIKAQIQSQDKCTIITKQKFVLKFQNERAAVRFWIKVSQMGIKVYFVPQMT